MNIWTCTCHTDPELPELTCIYNLKLSSPRCIDKLSELVIMCIGQEVPAKNLEYL